MSAAMNAQLVTDALLMAIWRRGKPDSLLHHADRGSQYTGEQFQRNVCDNAAMESFFSSLKTEHVTQDRARWPEGISNEGRRQGRCVRLQGAVGLKLKEQDYLDRSFR
jgi:transposase InsO family protein